MQDKFQSHHEQRRNGGAAAASVYGGDFLDDSRSAVTSVSRQDFQGAPGADYGAARFQGKTTSQILKQYGGAQSVISQPALPLYNAGASAIYSAAPPAQSVIGARSAAVLMDPSADYLLHAQEQELSIYEDYCKIYGDVDAPPAQQRQRRLPQKSIVQIPETDPRMREGKLHEQNQKDRNAYAEYTNSYWTERTNDAHKEIMATINDLEFQESHISRADVLERATYAAHYPKNTRRILSRTVFLNLYPNAGTGQAGLITQGDNNLIPPIYIGAAPEMQDLFRDSYAYGQGSGIQHLRYQQQEMGGGIQGLDAAEKPRLGNLENTFVTKIQALHWGNEWNPAPVGLQLQEAGGAIYDEANFGYPQTPAKASRFHFILPPKSTGPFGNGSDACNTLYRSNSSILGSMAQEWPEYSAHPKQILKGIQTVEGLYSVPLKHPIAKWYWENRAWYEPWDRKNSFYVLDHDDEEEEGAQQQQQMLAGPGSTTVEKMKMNKYDCFYIANLICNELKSQVPTKNISRLVLNSFILDQEKFKGFQLQRQSHTMTDVSPTQNGTKMEMDLLSIPLTLQIFYMFRENHQTTIREYVKAQQTNALKNSLNASKRIDLMSDV